VTQAPAISIEKALELAGTFRRAGQREYAESIYRKIITGHPDSVDAWNNLANMLLERRALGESIECFQRALAIRPDFAFSHHNLAQAFAEAGQFEDALRHSSRAVELNPESPDFNLAFATLLLLLGRNEEGWRHYEWRLHQPEIKQQLENFPTPRWDGGSVNTLLVQEDQGYGDTFHFLRYLPIVARRSGAQIIFACREKLLPILEPNMPHGIKAVAISSGMPVCDAYVPLLSIPWALQSFDPLPMPAPYLHADEGRRKLLREHMGPARALRVGLSWEGSSEHPRNRIRSIAPDLLRPVLDLNGIEFYSLQLGKQIHHENLKDFMPQIRDFADTAALMSELDLLISVDTAAAHLAGALGRPVWTLLPFAPDWRWDLESETTPWYPTMRLFRQPVIDDWSQVIEQVASQIRSLVTS